MNNKHLQRTLSILRRTGDKGIIIDGESDELFVLMGVDAYEKMLPEEAPAASKTPLTGSSTDDEFEDYVLDDLIDAAENSKKSHEIPPVDFELPIEKEKAVSFTEKTVNFEPTSEEEKTENSSEESLSDVPDDGEEEEKFYLEPVE